MIDDMRPVSFADYANFSAIQAAQPASSASDDKNWSESEDSPPPLPPRLPKNLPTFDLSSAPPTNPFRSHQTPVMRSQSLRTDHETSPAGSLTASISDLAAMDASHKRRSLKLSCGGGLLVPPPASRPSSKNSTTTTTTTTVNFSESCPTTPTSFSGSVTFTVPSATPSDISVQVNLSVCGSGEESRRYRYPFQPLVVGRTSPSPPPSVSSAVSKHKGTSPEDIECIATAQARLRQSGFYYEGITWLEAIELLTNKPEGTFLVRDSQDARFLFSLSVQTKRGPTSVRIHYESGVFFFDAARGMTGVVPRLPCVVSLVEHYVAVCDTGRLKSHVWLDKNGGTFDQVRLLAPLMNRVPSLRHAARLAINKANADGSGDRKAVLARLPAQIRQYLHEYPNGL